MRRSPRSCRRAPSIALIGTLGAGKTRLVQAVAEALGVPPRQRHQPDVRPGERIPGGRMPVYHFDTYRLKDEDEFLELGPEEYFESAGLTFVEWADRVADLLPAERSGNHDRSHRRRRRDASRSPAPSPRMNDVAIAAFTAACGLA